MKRRFRNLMISLVRPKNIQLAYPTKIRVASFLYSYLPHLSLYDITLLTGTIAYFVGWVCISGVHLAIKKFVNNEQSKVFCNINQSGLMGTKSEICQNCTEHLTRRLNPISSFFHRWRTLLWNHRRLFRVGCADLSD